MDNVYSDLGSDLDDFPGAESDMSQCEEVLLLGEEEVPELVVLEAKEVSSVVSLVARGEEIVAMMHGSIGDCGDDLDCPACNWRMEALQTVMELGGVDTLSELDRARGRERELAEEAA